MADPGGGPSEEQLAEQLEAALRQLKVSDLLVQTIYSISSLGYRRLGKEDRDLEQGKLAVDALRALVPVLQGSVADEVVRDFNQVTANMQLAYVAAVSEERRSAEATPAAGSEETVAEDEGTPGAAEEAPGTAPEEAPDDDG